MSKRLMREFEREQEETRAAKSKQAKRSRRKRSNAEFCEYLAEKAMHIEANGNPAAAKAFRDFWGRLGNGKYKKAFRHFGEEAP